MAESQLVSNARMNRLGCVCSWSWQQGEQWTRLLSPTISSIWPTTVAQIFMMTCWQSVRSVSECPICLSLILTSTSQGQPSCAQVLCGLRLTSCPLLQPCHALVRISSHYPSSSRVRLMIQAHHASCLKSQDLALFLELGRIRDNLAHTVLACNCPAGFICSGCPSQVCWHAPVIFIKLEDGGQSCRFPQMIACHLVFLRGKSRQKLDPDACP